MKNKKPGASPPHGIEAEQALLGACLLDSERMGQVAEICRPEDFAQPIHARIFRAAEIVLQRGDVVDLVSVANELEPEQASAFGIKSWIVYLSELAQASPSAARAGQYARLVRRNAEDRVQTSASQDLPPKYSHDRVADRFSRAYAEGLLYVEARKEWLQYDGTRWIVESTLLPWDLAREVCKALSIEAAADLELRPEQRAKVASLLCSTQTIAAGERLARADRRHARAADIWDRHPLMLNTPAGVVDLRTGELRGHDPRLYMTKKAGASPAEGCPLWQTFLDRVTGGDRELAGFLQRFIGSCLSGLVRDHRFIFLYGRGANGKSTFLNVLQRVLGEYAIAAPMQMFVESGVERHPTELARLEGARLVVAQEIEEGQRFKLALLKALTGGDPLTARLMRRDFFTFQPQCKLILAGNHKPSQRHVDEALRRRLCLVPFTQTIPAHERDPDLPEKLLEEAGGILRWAIDGCLMWQERGLAPPAAVMEATDAYLDDEDIFRQWLDAHVERDPKAFTPVAELRASYQQWAEAMGERFLGVKRFSQALEDHGFARERGGRSGIRGFLGGRLMATQGRLSAVD